MTAADPAEWPDTCPLGCEAEFDRLAASEAPYRRHRYHGTPMCPMASALHRAFTRRRRGAEPWTDPGGTGTPVCRKPLSRGATTPGEPATGTLAGYRRHYKAGEQPCPECLEAHNAAARQRRLRSDTDPADA